MKLFIYLILLITLSNVVPSLSSLWWDDYTTTENAGDNQLDRSTDGIVKPKMDRSSNIENSKVDLESMNWPKDQELLCDPVREYKCKVSGECILSDKVCDGVYDCSESDDEANCTDQNARKKPVIPSKPITQPAILPVVCRSHEYLCQGSLKCIDQRQRCDGTYQCPKGDDEAECYATRRHNIHNHRHGSTEIPVLDSRLECDPVREFKCKVSGKCISSEKVCDGVYDCYDAEDEANCLNRFARRLPLSPAIQENQVRCDSHQLKCHGLPVICISQHQRCDGKNDCPNNEDEAGCHRPVDNNYAPHRRPIETRPIDLVERPSDREEECNRELRIHERRDQCMRTCLNI